jgi:hypothetical protein
MGPGHSSLRIRWTGQLAREDARGFADIHTPHVARAASAPECGAEVIRSVPRAALSLMLLGAGKQCWSQGVHRPVTNRRWNARAQRLLRLRCPTRFKRLVCCGARIVPDAIEF